MKTRLSHKRIHGFTLIEVFVVIAVIALLAFVFFPGLVRTKKHKLQMDCVDNLKQIGLAFRLWPPDSSDAYQMKRSTNYGGTMEYVPGGNVYRHFLSMSNELGNPKILTCPADNRLPAKNFAELSNSNISYFVGVDATEMMPQMFLTGDRNLATNGVPVSSGVALVRSNDLVSWTGELHNGKGNVGLADGSVQWTTSTSFQKMNHSTGTNLNRLAFP